MDLKEDLKSDHKLENEFILRCVRAFVDEDPDKLVYPQQEINWDYLLRMAKEQGVLPLIYWSINSHYAKYLPVNILAHLARDFKINAAHNLLLLGELLKVLSILRDNSIEVISFKGPILALSIYGELTLRQFRDLDILVRPDDFLKARDLLLLEGYTNLPSTSAKEWEAILKYDKSQNHSLFYKKDSEINIELHWAVYMKIYPSRLETDDLFGRGESLEFFGNVILSMSPEDMLIFSCNHAAKHNYSRISWICDIAMILKSGSINWSYVIKFVRNAGIERSFNLSLFLAYDLLQAPVPDFVLEELLQNRVIRSLALETRANMFQNIDFSFLQVSIFRLRTLTNPIDRFNYILYFIGSIILPNELDRRYMKLPESVSFAYFLVRPIRTVHLYLLYPAKKFLLSKRKD